MTNRKLRWGILGTAKINQRLMPAFRSAPSVDLVGIASRDPAKAEQAAQQDGIPNAYGSYDALLADPAIEAVYIPLPNSLHAEWTRKAADAGKHILCEKPLTPTAEEAAALVAYCRDKNVRLMDGFMWPHHPRTQQLKTFLDQGGIGPIKRVTSAFTFQMDQLSPSNIRLQSNLGGGSLLDVGCYPVFGIRWAFAAEPVRVFASAHYAHDCDVEMSALLWFADGRMASFDCGFTSPFRGWLEIVGETGTVEIPEMWLPSDPATYTILRQGDAPEDVAIGGYDQMVCMLDDFAQAVWENRDPVPAPEEAIKTLAVIDALTQSAQQHEVVEVRTGLV